MSEPRTYEIRSVRDFLQVPIERRGICLEEFDAWLAVIEAAEAIRIDGKSVLENVPQVFGWCDDGKGEARISLNVEGETVATTVLKL